MPTGTVAKKIYFYQVIGEVFDNQDRREVEVQPIFDHIHGLTIESAYQNRNDGDHVLVKIFSRQGTTEGVIGLCRRHNLPYKENAGRESPLQLDTGESLFEPAHFILFDQNVLGMEYNHSGPRTFALKRYLQDKGRPWVKTVTIAPILNKEAYRKLRQLDEIKVFKIAVRSDGIARTAALNSCLHETLKQSQKVGKSEIVEVTLTAPRSKKGHLEGFSAIRQKLLRWIGVPENREVVDRFEIKGYDSETGKVDIVDMLEEQVISNKVVLTEDSRYRHVSSDVMLRAIREAYRENRDEIMRALAGD